MTDQSDASFNGKLKAGERMKFHNSASQTLGISIEMGDGAAVRVNVLMGQSIEITAGQCDVVVRILDAQGDLVGKPHGAT